MVELARNENAQPADTSGKSPDGHDSAPVKMPAPKSSKVRAKIKRSVLMLALLAGASATGYYGYQYWTIGRYLETTDDAYVKADYTVIAPKVAGYISDVAVRDNQHVTQGQVLARIDDRDFRAHLAQASADVSGAEATLRNLDAQIALQRLLVEQARAAVDATQASLTFAQADAKRYHELMRNGAGTVQRAQKTESVRKQMLAELERNRVGLIAAQKKIDVLSTQHEQAEAQLQRVRAIEHQAELNLSYTKIVAPIDGYVGARSLRVGQYVNAGTQLMAIVPLRGTYIVANFKETQLTFLRNGQAVHIRVDGFPEMQLNGSVDSVSPASGLEFSLLPPDNATGNFTKIVQRIPVKIALDDPKLAGMLRAGMSVESTIDTKATVLAMGEAKNRVAGAVNDDGAGGGPKTATPSPPFPREEGLRGPALANNQP